MKKDRHKTKDHDPESIIFDDDHTEPILKTPVPANMPVLRQLSIAILLLMFVLSTSWVGILMNMNNPDPEADSTVFAQLPVSYEDTGWEDPFASVAIAGKSAFVWDVQKQHVLFEQSADTILPLASVTKLMTALVAYELLDDETTITISQEAVKMDGDTGLKAGEHFTLKDLTDLVLLASSNDGATALAAAAGASIDSEMSPEETFVAAMNLRAEQLGLTNTVFKNTTGLDISPNEAGAYSTARDVALLLEYIITTYPQVASLTSSDETKIFNDSGEYHEVRNTNVIVSQIDGLLASKTGYTDLAGGNLAIAFESGLNRPIIVVVLGSTYDERFTDVLTLTDSARAYVAGSHSQ